MKKEIIEQVRQYLTSQFIWSDATVPPSDECLVEATHVYGLIRSAERASLPESVERNIERAKDFLAKVPMDSDANLDEVDSALFDALEDLRKWKAGEV